MTKQSILEKIEKCYMSYMLVNNHGFLLKKALNSLIKNLTYLATCRPIGSITIGDPFLRANLVNVCTLIYFFPFTFPSYSSCHDHKFCVTVAILSD